MFLKHTRIILLLSLCLCYKQGIGQVYDTVDIYFSLNDAQLTPRASQQIDSLIFHDVLIHWQKYTVLGYTDYVGGKAYNETLSKARAQNVKDYLIKMGFEPGDITLCMGKGQINHAPVNGKEGIASDRKVQIIIDGNHSGERKSKPTSTASSKTTQKELLQSEPDLPQIIVKGSTPINLAVMNVSQSAVLKNLLFKRGTHILLLESTDELKNLYNQLHINPSVTIRIEGHVCCMGEDDTDDYSNPDNFDRLSASNPQKMLQYMMSQGGDSVKPIAKKYTDFIDIDQTGWLSETRAKAIYDYLINKGIEAHRLKFVGYGHTRPLFHPETTSEQKRLDRRVEIRVLSK